jgi:hypothetical protein
MWAGESESAWEILGAMRGSRLPDSSGLYCGISNKAGKYCDEALQIDRCNGFRQRREMYSACARALALRLVQTRGSEKCTSCFIVYFVVCDLPTSAYNFHMITVDKFARAIALPLY